MIEFDYSFTIVCMKSVGTPRVDPRTHEPNPQASSVPLPHGTHGPR